MSRKPSVRYWSSRKAFCCWIDGVQHTLGPGPDDSAEQGPRWAAAVKRYAELVCLKTAPDAKDNSKLATVVELYLEWVEVHRPRCLTPYRSYLQPLCKALGNLSVAELRATHVEDYCAARRKEAKRYKGWGRGSTRNLISTLAGCLNWAVRRKLITANPLRGINCPGPGSRGAEMLVSPELHDRVLEYIGNTDPFRDVILALHNTGARPGEVINATAADWNEAGYLLYLPDNKRPPGRYRHKKARIDNNERTVVFTGEALDTVRRLVKQHPTGKLFLNRRKKAYTLNRLHRRFQQLRRALNVENLNPYSYRHSFITSALNSGLPPVKVARLVGNSPEQITKTYSHVDALKDEMRRDAETLSARGEEMAPVVDAIKLLEEYMRTRDASKLASAMACLEGLQTGTRPVVPLRAV
jgi:integrase